MASKNSLCASGEIGKRPAVHIWDSATQQNYGIIRGLHRDGVHLLQFFKKDEFLATAGLRYDSPILIYSIKDLSLVLSTCMQ